MPLASEETIRIVVVAAVGLNLVLLAALLLVLLVRSARTPVGPPPVDQWRPGPGRAPAEGLVPLDWMPEPSSGPAEAAYDRIFRIASWSFVLTAAAVVALSGMWTANLPWIVGLLAVAGASVLIVHDVLPAAALRATKGIAQALVAILCASLLVMLTGGYQSPFFFAFPLLVGGASLVLSAGAAMALAVVAALAYLVSATVGGGPPSSSEAVTAAVDLAGIAVLAYVASAVGREQRRARDAAIRVSAIDSLTGLYSRPFLFAAIGREIARSERTGRGFCLVMLDLDELKAVNDRYGHHAGDLVLRAVADTLRSIIRRVDIPARHSGDEFVALLPETDPTGAWVVAEKIRQVLRERRIPGLDFKPTVSLGVVSYPADGRSAETLMISADRALYIAKRGGKDRVAGAASVPTIMPIESAPAPVDGERTG